MTHNLNATIFVYRNRDTKEIRAEYINGAMVMTSEWEHLATLDPRLWIQAHWDDQEKEREACAKFIEDDYVRQFEEPWRQNLAAAIRARGET